MVQVKRVNEFLDSQYTEETYSENGGAFCPYFPDTVTSLLYFTHNCFMPLCHPLIILS